MHGARALGKKCRKYDSGHSLFIFIVVSGDERSGIEGERQVYEGRTENSDTASTANRF
jgi:hypothetical protein|tara:strand:+ start:2051 stop:2224 length:174 start_codon:yes stop_codon:yes gene_type:complete